MYVGMFKSVRVKPGCEKRFEFLMDAFGNDLTLLEPGCRMRSVMRSPTDPHVYTVHEEYWNEEAWEVHNLTDHKRKYCPSILDLVEYCRSSRFDLAPES